MSDSILRNIKKSIKENRNPRIIILQAMSIVLCLILLRQLWRLQIVDGEAYAENFELKITKTIIEKGARGNIYDCNGNILASNQLVYTITMTDNGVYDSNRERQLALNSIIYRLREKLHQYGDQFYNEFKIMVNADGEYEYTVDGTALQRFKADIFGKRSPDEMSEEQSAMSASEMMRYLSANDQFALYGTGEEAYTADELAQYGLPESFAEELSKEAVLDIVGIRYQLSLHSYRQYQTVTIARDISPETMAYVFENKTSFPGIEVEEGEVLREASVGNDVYLSIDKDLQTATYQILEQTLAGILSSNLIDAKYLHSLHSIPARHRRWLYRRILEKSLPV